MLINEDQEKRPDLQLQTRLAILPESDTAITPLGESRRNAADRAAQPQFQDTDQTSATKDDLLLQVCRTARCSIKAVHPLLRDRTASILKHDSLSRLGIPFSAQQKVDRLAG